MKGGHDMDTNKQKHLEFIQHVVTRMGGNLFYLRGWSITLIGGLLALLSQRDNDDRFPLVILTVVIIMFWFYDGYFLSQERKFRDLYNKVRKLSNNKIDYSMDTSEFNNHKKNTLVFCMFSKTIAPFYILFFGTAIYLIIKG